jgi:hypothetical protein
MMMLKQSTRLRQNIQGFRAGGSIVRSAGTEKGNDLIQTFSAEHSIGERPGIT